MYTHVYAGRRHTHTHTHMQTQIINLNKAADLTGERKWSVKKKRNKWNLQKKKKVQEGQRLAQTLNIDAAPLLLVVDLA